MLGKALMLIHTGRAPTRSVLTSALGVTRATAGTLVGDLQDLGLIQVDDGSPQEARQPRQGQPRQGQPRPGQPRPGQQPPQQAQQAQQGRPSHRLSIDPAGPVVLAAEVHADGYQVALVGLGAQIIAAQYVTGGIPADPSRALAEVAEVAAGLLADAGRPCAGAGLAVASAIASLDGTLVSPVGLSWPDGTPVRDLFAGHLRRAGIAGPGGRGLRCSVANDINCAALAEYRHGAGQGASHLLMLATGNRGVGGALVLGGALYTGSTGLGMEAGHVSVDASGRPCPCGMRGCLNVEADATRFLQAAGQDPARAHLPTEHDLAIDVLRRDYEADPRVRAAAGLITARLGVGLAGLVNVLNPDRVLLGGLYRHLLEADPVGVRAAVADRGPWGRAAGIPLLPAALERGGLIGAAEIAWQPVLDDPGSLARESASDNLRVEDYPAKWTSRDAMLASIIRPSDVGPWPHRGSERRLES